MYGKFDTSFDMDFRTETIIRCLKIICLINGEGFPLIEAKMKMLGINY